MGKSKLTKVSIQNLPAHTIGGSGTEHAGIIKLQGI